MQKSFVIALVAAVVGAWVIFQFMPTFPAYLAFVAGALLAIALIALIPIGASASAAIDNDEDYQGPTTTLYIGNLPYRVQEAEVKALFAEFGPVNSVRLVRDRKTGRRKGFGFVEMAESGAQKAMAKLNDYSFQDRTLKVRQAKSQENEANTAED